MKYKLLLLLINLSLVTAINVTNLAAYVYLTSKVAPQGANSTIKYLHYTGQDQVDEYLAVFNVSNRETQLRYGAQHTINTLQGLGLNYHDDIDYTERYRFRETTNTEESGRGNGTNDQRVVKPDYDNKVYLSNLRGIKMQRKREF